MAGVSIRIEGDQLALRQLEEAARRIEHPEPVWNEIGQLLITSTQMRFELERAPDGNPWPPSIRVLTEGGKTLTDTAHLRNSIAKEVFADGVAVGTDLIYAGVHQFGAVITAKTDAGLMFKIGGHFVRKDAVTIPQRAFLGVDREDEAEMALAWEGWLGEPLGASHAH